MKKLIVCTLLASFCIFSLGCFDIEQSLKLESDLSGTAKFHLGINFEPMVLIMLQFQREMEGKEGPPTAEEIEAAKAEFRAKMTEEDDEDLDAKRAELEESLPDGIGLLDMAIEKNDMTIGVSLAFSFDDVAKLKDIKMPEDEGAGPDDPMSFDDPFAGLEVIDEGDTILIRTKPTDPTKKVLEQTSETGAPDSPEFEKMMEDAFSDLRVAWEIDAPFEIVEHNATRQEGTLLIWEFDVEALEKMGEEAIEDVEVMVRYRK